MKRALLILSTLLATALMLLAPQLIGYVSASIRKTGVVIDDETGRPMPNVIVIASGWHRSGPVLFGPGGQTLLYREVTRTDDEGRYQIPAHWSEYSIDWPGSHAEYIWVVTVFKVGYAVVGDEPNKELFAFGNPWYRTPSTLASPPYAFRGSYFEVEPIRLFKPTLNLKEAALYYEKIKNAGSSYVTLYAPGEIAIRKQGYDLLAPWVCGLDPKLEIEIQTGGAIRGFSVDLESADRLGEQYAASRGYRYLSMMPSIPAGVLCKIITNGRGVP